MYQSNKVNCTRGNFNVQLSRESAPKVIIALHILYLHCLPIVRFNSIILLLNNYFVGDVSIIGAPGVSEPRAFSIQLEETINLISFLSTLHAIDLLWSGSCSAEQHFTNFYVLPLRRTPPNF